MIIVMKDYRNEIMPILIANLKLDYLSNPDENKIPGLSGLEKAVNEISSMINSEVEGLEAELVNLTEQLAENDFLLFEANKTTIPHIARRSSRLRVTKGQRLAQN